MNTLIYCSCKLWLYCTLFNAHARSCLISTSDLKFDVTVVFLDPICQYAAGISAIHEHLPEIGIFMFAWIFRTVWPKMAVFGGKIGEGVVQC